MLCATPFHHLVQELKISRKSMGPGGYIETYYYVFVLVLLSKAHTTNIIPPPSLSFIVQVCSCRSLVVQTQTFVGRIKKTRGTMVTTGNRVVITTATLVSSTHCTQIKRADNHFLFSFLFSSFSSSRSSFPFTCSPQQSESKRESTYIHPPPPPQKNLSPLTFSTTPLTSTLTHRRTTTFLLPDASRQRA